MEILREIYWESKRAPATNATLNRNPYRREQIIKKHFGRTAAERKIKKAELQKWITETKEKVDAAEINLQVEEEKKKESIRVRRRKNAAIRQKLGFDDQGKEEVEDPIIEELEYND